MRQIGFSFLRNYQKEFGGEYLKGRRKTIRPLSTKAPIHLVLKSTQNKVFNPRQKIIHELIRKECARFGVKLYDCSPNWSHIHMLIRIPNRDSYKRFIRSLTSQLVKCLSVAIGDNLKGLFDLRPYTKVISWGRQFKRVLNYHILNQAEAIGGEAHREHLRVVFEYTKSRAFIGSFFVNNT